MIGAAVVTIPSCAYLLQPDPNKGHGHGHGHEKGEHAEHEGDVKGEDEAGVAPESETGQADGEEEGTDQSPDNASQGEGANEGASDDRPRPDHSVQDAGQGQPDKSSDEDPKAGAYEVDSGNDVDGVRFKGSTSGGTEEGVQGDTRKYIPDAKGGYKHRIESHYAKEQGVLGEDDPGNEDQVSHDCHHCLLYMTLNRRLACSIEIVKFSQLTVGETAWTLQHPDQTFHRYHQ